MIQEETIKIKYHTDIPELKTNCKKQNWIDLYAAEDAVMNKGEYKIISLGVSMKLPDNYEAIIVPRSSTFKNFGIIQTNHFGVIDTGYQGTNDVWAFPALAIRNTEIRKGDRICQFRIQKVQPSIKFDNVDALDGIDRGGFGSTGTR